MPDASASTHQPARRVIVLGATGSIGRQTLDVIAQLNAQRNATPNATPNAARYEVVGLAAGSSAEALATLASAHPAAALAIASPPNPGAITSAAGVAVFEGPDAPERLVREIECDLVVAAIVGVAGLASTFAAIELGRDVALANKETLVAAGSLAMPLASQTGARILPIDSEHAGIWQCLLGAMSPSMGASAYAPPAPPPSAIERVTITASGGPFLNLDASAIARATPADALRHPTWRMGPKNTIDSASLMNKTLELIEAHHLFNLPASRLAMLIHPRSIVHAIVEMRDGQLLAQLGAPDMRGAIQHALTFPAREPATCDRLDLRELGSLTFEPVDTARFPAATLGERAINEGGSAGAVLNAANEIAVRAFLDGAITFDRIPALVESAMDTIQPHPLRDITDAQQADTHARALTLSRL